MAFSLQEFLSAIRQTAFEYARLAAAGGLTGSDETRIVTAERLRRAVDDLGLPLSPPQLEELYVPAVPPCTSHAVTATSTELCPTRPRLEC